VNDDDTHLSLPRGLFRGSLSFPLKINGVEFRHFGLALGHCFTPVFAALVTSPFPKSFVLLFGGGGVSVLSLEFFELVESL